MCDGVNYGQCLEWCELAVQLQNNVHIVFDRFARRGDVVDNAADQGVLGHVAVARRNRIELDRRKSVMGRGAGVLSEFFGSRAPHEQV